MLTKALQQVSESELLTAAILSRIYSSRLLRTPENCKAGDREFTVATASLTLYGWKKMVNSIVAFGVFRAALVS